jgi:hypothetical protein
MGLYDRFVLPVLLECTCGSRPIAYQRRKVVPQAKGRVLEVGMGSGLNLPYYDAGQVERVFGLDPAGHLLAKAERAWQHRLNPLWRRIGGGCNLDRDMPTLIGKAGFRIERLESMYLPKTPRFAGFNVWGTAAP